MIQVGFGVQPPEIEAEFRSRCVKLTENKRDRMIGHICFNIDTLIAKYKQQRYDMDGNAIEDFKLMSFLKGMWDDMNAATGNLHDFKINIDHNTGNQARVIDMNFQKDKELDISKLHELKIQNFSPRLAFLYFLNLFYHYY